MHILCLEVLFWIEVKCERSYHKNTGTLIATHDLTTQLNTWRSASQCHHNQINLIFSL
jgi:hypothetical protein